LLKQSCAKYLSSFLLPHSEKSEDFLFLLASLFLGKAEQKSAAAAKM